MESCSEPGESEALTHHYVTVWGCLLWCSLPWHIKIYYSEWFKVGKHYVPALRDRRCSQTLSPITLPPCRISVGISSSKIPFVNSILFCPKSLGNWGQMKGVREGTVGLSFSFLYFFFILHTSALSSHSPAFPPSPLPTLYPLLKEGKPSLRSQQSLA